MSVGLLYQLLDGQSADSPNAPRMTRRYRDRLLGGCRANDLPLAAGLVRKYAAARFARLLAALYRSGVAPHTAVTAASEAIGNRAIRRSLTSAAPLIRQGQPMSVALAQSRFMPDIVVSMIRTGEQSGNMDFTLDKGAEYLELEAASTTKRKRAPPASGSTAWPTTCSISPSSSRCSSNTCGRCPCAATT